MMIEKLSKRKKKALAFRGKKGKEATNLDDDEESKAIPIEQQQEPIETTSSSWLGNDSNKGPSSTKRKRNDSEKTSKPDRSPKKRKVKDQVEKPLKEPNGKKRYIVFLGNLPHQPSSILQPAIQAHFPVPPISTRIPLKKSTNAPQGYAFLEFEDSSALEKALRLHHTTLLGRKVNVELTAGGGGKGEHRMGKIKVKNEGLEEERRKRAEEEKKEKKDKGVAQGIHPDRLKRMKNT
jgi:nucleolar protein 6